MHYQMIIELLMNKNIEYLGTGFAMTYGILLVICLLFSLIILSLGNKTWVKLFGFAFLIVVAWEMFGVLGVFI